MIPLKLENKKFNRLLGIKPIGKSKSQKIMWEFLCDCDAKKRKHTFKLSKKLFKQLIDDNCFYCNTLPFKVMNTNNGQYVYNGIDRVNTKIGYVKNNVVSCCRNCNVAKAQLSKNEFLILIEKIYNNRIKNV